MGAVRQLFGGYCCTFALVFLQVYWISLKCVICVCSCMCEIFRRWVCVCRDACIRFCVSVCVLLRLCLALRTYLPCRRALARSRVGNIEHAKIPVPFWCFMTPSKCDVTWIRYMRIKCARSAHEDSSLYISGVPFPGPWARNLQISRIGPSAKK